MLVREVATCIGRSVSHYGSRMASTTSLFIVPHLEPTVICCLLDHGWNPLARLQVEQAWLVYWRPQPNLAQSLSDQIRSDQSLSRVRLFATQWIAACQASLSITNSWSSLRLTPIESVMPSSHLILCRPLLLLPSIPPSIRVFSNESTLRRRWLKYWSFSFSIIPSKEIPGLISFRMDWWISLQSKGLSRVFSNTTVQKHQFFGAQPSSQSNSHIHTWPQEKP